jgi:hypothetical protein
MRSRASRITVTKQTGRSGGLRICRSNQRQSRDRTPAFSFRRSRRRPLQVFDRRLRCPTITQRKTPLRDSWGLAREGARESARNNSPGRPGDRRRVEVCQGDIAGGAGVVARRHRLHGRDVQERRQDDIRQGGGVTGPCRFIQLEPRWDCQARDRYPRRREHQ